LIIAYLINQYPQPSHTFIRREIAALEGAGVTVHRITLRGSTGTLVDPADRTEQSQTRAILDTGSIKILRAVTRTLLTRPRCFAAALALTRLFSRASSRGRIAHLAYLAEACVLQKWLADAKVTHLHAHFGTNSTAVAAICRELGGPPFSFTTHGPEEFDQPIGLSLGEKATRAAFAVTISAFGRSQLCRWCDPSVWPRIHVVRCGVDQAFLGDAETGQIPTEARFVCVGRLEPQKGQLLLLDAFAAVARTADSSKLRLTLIGDGSLRPQIEQKIKDLGLAGIVHLAGWRSGPQIREEILASRAMILPSFAEGLPVVLMESLALGRPVISSWVAGIPELVTPSCGWLAPPGDVEGLVTAIQTAIDATPSQLMAMGQDGRRRVLEKHNSVTEASKLSHLFTGPVA
jgi:colanic acid/amylovoran biosynthesis glycosyltransferase